MRLVVTGQASFPPPRRTTVGQVLSEEEDGRWAAVEGWVRSVRKQREGVGLDLGAGAGRMRVEVADEAGLPVARLLNSRIRAVGFCESVFTPEGQRVAGLLLVPSGKEIEFIGRPLERQEAGQTATNGETLSVLTTAAAIRGLTPPEARRRHPIKLQGVVTCILADQQAFVIQDATAGLYAVESSTNRFELPRFGEFLEIQGVTDQPGIAQVLQIKRLGAGSLPEPVHPAWDQLMNGSLDSQWVEIGGLVESLVNRSNGWSQVNLRTRAGVLKVELRRAGIRLGPLERYINAVVRLHGCMFADWRPNLRLKVGQIRMYNVDVLVEEPAPTDVFSIPRKTASETHAL